MTAPTPRPGILDIKPYVGGAHTAPGVDRVFVLSANEGPLGPSPKAIAAFRDCAETLHRYPDGGVDHLRQAIAAHHGLDPARIVCGAGSDELITMLNHAYAGPGDEVLYSRHGFLMYALSAKAAGATPVAAPETDLTADVDALLAQVTPRTRICFLANPNNPTGTYLSRDELLRLRAGLREDILLVVDAAYAEYVRRNDYTAGIDLVDGGDNVVMTRTFSKIYGLAALRLGWAYCPDGVAGVLNRVRGPFNVNAPAQAAGAAAIADAAHTDAARVHNDTWLPWLSEQLRALGITVHPSIGNFVLADFGDAARAQAASDFLFGCGVIVRAMVPYGLGHCLRVSVGSEEELRAAVDGLAAFLSSEDTNRAG
jgi:histidinol-phosphate aminotransferase